MGNSKESTVKKRGSWDEKNMEAALKAVSRGILTQRAASDRYKIPRRTLRDHLESGNCTKRLGRKSVLSQEQEQDLVKRIIRMADIGLPLTMKMLRFNVFKFCKLHNIRNNFNEDKQKAGRDWMRGFLKRNPEISRRKAQFMNQARAQKLNKFIVEDHFKKLGEVLDNLDIKNKPEKIFNMDEKGCRLTLHHQPTVVAKTGAKRVHFISNEHAENVTIVGCVSAIGNPIPPMIIFKGKRLKPEFADDLPPGSIVRMAPKGYMTTELFIDFIKHLANFKPPDKILLVFDGAACHLDLAILNAAEERDIVLYCLPSNTTHELQPLDKSVYRSYEHHWDMALLQYQPEHPDRKINKTSFNKIFTSVWSKCMTNSNITNGFRAVGIFPFNPDAIPETAFAPSVLTARDLNSNNADNLNSSSSSTMPNIEPQILQPTPRRNATVSTEESSDSDEDRPLAELKSKENIAPKTPFQKFLPTPNMKQSSNTRQRKKAINYKAQKVTKDLFQRKEDNIPSTSKSPPEINQGSSALKDGNWYCPACNENRVVDMRQCLKCKTWYHEDCVGLTEDDLEFECPNC